MSDYKLVPMEPTAEMVGAAKDAYMPFGDMGMAIRMALLEAPDVQGEPVAWQRKDRPERMITKLSRRSIAEAESGVEFIPLYTSPQPDVSALQAECKEIRTTLAESRANDRQAMYYLNQVREIVGGNDFPDMVERCRGLQAECERLQAESPEMVLFKFKNECGGE